MARSLATGPPLVALVVSRRAVGGQGVELALEVADVGLHRAGLAAAHPQDPAADQAQDQGDAQEDECVHARGTSATGWAQADQSSPPAQTSRFQIGAVAFSVSMQNRAASNASS